MGLMQTKGQAFPCNAKNKYIDAWKPCCNNPRKVFKHSGTIHCLITASPSMSLTYFTKIITLAKFVASEQLWESDG